ncbi:pyridoxal phosphate-dependent aminotransferase [Jannaschia seohaensis]|uniref:Histidinol-phosphate aminotransferase n=1 Tax=Jannaschia seohaensis TaxID=475081 RepID=A0A2Y9B1F6_9RHOB|nr:pyridoxal phosphate-dependent aminotransferase [Jannaschia seohaensis]PWJ16245.1 histidinol-phosphate aminotransferase [Jannaschia seohaensis]SSA49318.1 histidinol-phosphate aminotransferase [Jannaschia seohaensis]
MTHRLTDLAASLPASVPFVGPEAQERARGAPFTARLGANESPFGPSPRAVAAMEAAARDVWKYGDPEYFDLRHDLAAHHGVRPEEVVCGEGIDGLLGYLVRLLVGPGDAVVTSAGAYPTFGYHVTGYGGTIHTVPYRDDHEDPEALAAKAREMGAKLVYLANPDNPMGTWLPVDAIARMLDALPEGCLLCLDEAYADLAPPEAVPPLDTSDGRLIRMRTFSKAHGLAGLRVGYALGHADLIGAFDRVRNHFGLGRVAQAGARAALADTAWHSHVLAQVAQSRDAIAAIGRANGLTPIPSATNFVTLDCGRDGAFARRVLERLIERGIFVRMPGVAPLDRCVRISCGTPADMEALAAALPLALVDAATPA